MTIPFGRRRLVFTFDLITPSPTAATRAMATTAVAGRPSTVVPDPIDATDREWTRMQVRSELAAEHRRWQIQSILLGGRG